MVSITACFVFSSLLVSSLGVPFGKRTVAQIEADISAITTDGNTLNSDIEAFAASPTSLPDALQIHTDSTTLDSALKQATTDVTANGPLNDPDATTILNSIKPLQATIFSALNQIVAEKSSFAALPITGVPALVKQDLTALSTDTEALENALISVFPADLVSQVTSIKTAIDAAYSAALEAYADA